MTPPTSQIEPFPKARRAISAISPNNPISYVNAIAQYPLNPQYVIVEPFLLYRRSTLPAIQYSLFS